MDHIENATVAELAAHSLAAVRVFEKYGLDYCCGGKRPLAEACLQKGQNADEVKEELEAALRDSPAADNDWSASPLRQLCDHIEAVHHGFLRRELPAIQTRLDKVYRIYNQRYGPTLTGLPEAYAELRQELEPHMQKEEMILFPAIRSIEEAMETHRPPARLMFGSLANPIHSMEAEHDNAGTALQRIRKITDDFDVPLHACVTYRALMSGLSELEKDLHLHIHLENNILFPRAAQMETAQALTA